MTTPSYPDFASAEFLRSHVESILAFYEPNVYDKDGGFFQHFLDDGSIYDKDTRHLVSSTRFIYNYVNAYLHTKREHYRDWAAHGLHYLATHHKMPSGHYLWQRRGTIVDDGRALAYGHAFVLLAASHAARLEIDGARQLLDESWELLERLFWEAEHSAYADERDDTLNVLSPYRGQNANMHMVEALIAAYETTQDAKYLNRADLVAKRFTVELAAKADNQVWEHYTTDWQLDWKYNIDKPDDLFKPWGFQPGHQAEWAKLLLQIDAHRPADWHQTRAEELFAIGMERAWDDAYGGLVYDYKPTGKFADPTKYFWVQAESFATAWRLYKLTGAEHYRTDYQRLWAWAWDHLIDHQHGGWYRIVSRAGNWLEPYKSPAGKTDYHTMGACWDILSQL